MYVNRHAAMLIYSEYIAYIEEINDKVHKVSGKTMTGARVFTHLEWVTMIIPCTDLHRTLEHCVLCSKRMCTYRPTCMHSN